MKRWFGRPDADLQDEIRAHIAIATDENIERGMSPAAARRAAERAFGNAGVAREEVREGRPLYWLDTLRQDVRHGARLMRRSPVSTLVIIATLTFGVGLNTGIFTMVNAELFRVAVDDPSTYVKVYPQYSGEQGRGTAESGRVTREDYLAYRNGTQTLRTLAAWHSAGGVLDDDDSVRVSAVEISCEYFAVYNIRATLGRLFGEEECAAPAARTVTVLTEELWRNRYDADPHIVGRVVRFDRHALTIVGVAAAAGDQPARGGLWVPLATPVSAGLDPFRLEGRLRPGVARQEAEAELNVIASQIDRLYPGRKTHVVVTAGARFQEPGAAPRLLGVLALILGALLLILMLVSVNVSLLLLARAATRRREIALRVSLGAGRVRLLRMLLTEVLLLATASAAGGAWVAYWFPQAFFAIVNKRVPYPLEPDWRVFLYLGIVSLTAGCVAGLAPALESLKVDLAESLKGRDARSGTSRWAVRDYLVAAQVALSLMLLAASGVIVKAAYGVFVSNPGFDADRVLIVYSPLRFPPYTPQSAAAFYREFTARINALPGVEAVASATSIRSGDETEWVTRYGEPASLMRTAASANVVSPSFFRAIGVQIVRGRAFTAEEATAAAPVTIVSETLAARMWPEADPLGSRMADGRGRALEVVGVVRDTDPALGVFHSARAQFYRVRTPQTDDDDLLIRYGGDVRVLKRAVRDVVRTLDGDLMASTETLRGMIDRTVGDARHLTTLGLSFGLVAVLLAVIGLYGVVAFAAAQRTREFGIRMALGATRGQILRMVLGTGFRPVLVGLVVGVATTRSAAQLLARQLSESPIPLNGRDPVLYVSVVLLLALAAIAAMMGPARRAARLDPSAFLFE